MIQNSFQGQVSAAESRFGCLDDTDNLLADATQGLLALVCLVEGQGAELRQSLDAVKREDLACLLRLIGHKLEHVRASYRDDMRQNDSAANQN